jgi:hypothetical protein
MTKGADGKPSSTKKAVEDYIVPLDEKDKIAYANQRVTSDTVAAE